MTRFVVYDVFTRSVFGGNPLAVIPDATGLDERSLQRIAREFNFSETTFVYPPEDAKHDARVRIFTPTMEVPFAGHPTVGTAVALFDMERAGASMVLELGVGPIAVEVSDGGARFETRVPLQVWDGPDAELIGQSIGVSPEKIRTDRHAPVIAGVGLPFALAELCDRDALQQAAPVTDVFRAIDQTWPTETHYDLLVYIREGNQISARMFAPLDGIPEDPATGSAAAALAAYLGQLENSSQRFSISQGVEMGRPSEIDAEVSVEDGQVAAVRIGGNAVKVMDGNLAF